MRSGDSGLNCWSFPIVIREVNVRLILISEGGELLCVQVLGCCQPLFWISCRWLALGCSSLESFLKIVLFSNQMRLLLIPCHSCVAYYAKRCNFSAISCPNAKSRLLVSGKLFEWARGMFLDANGGQSMTFKVFVHFAT